MSKQKYPSSVQIMYDNDRCDFIGNIGKCNFGEIWLMRDKQRNENVAIKYIERGGPVSLLFLLLIMCVFSAHFLSQMILLQAYCKLRFNYDWRSYR